MFVFVCARCDAELAGPLSQVCLPVHAHQKYGNGIQLPVLMEPGTFAVDPEPWGPPWRQWEELSPGEAEARGIYAPVHALPEGAPGAIVIAPGDVRGTRLIPEKSGGACCGLDGRDGPNMACLACGLAVASRIDDCSLWQAVWLAPQSVRRVFVDDADAAPLSWEELLGEAAAGRALAHLMAASEGRPLGVPDSLIADVFQRAHDIVRDDPPLPFPGHPFRADRGTFRHALVRLPAVRSPWLRRILENLTQHTAVGLF